MVCNGNAVLVNGCLGVDGIMVESYSDVYKRPGLSSLMVTIVTYVM